MMTKHSAEVTMLGKFLRSSIFLTTACFLFEAGCKQAPTTSLEAAVQKNNGEKSALTIENLKKKIDLPPELRRVFQDLYGNHKEQLEATVQSVVKTAKTATAGTPEQKASLLITSIRSITLAALEPTSAALAPMFKISAEKIKIGAQAELETFLSQKKWELVHSFQRNAFGFPAGTRSFFKATELVSILGAEKSSSKNDIEVALSETPNEPSPMALASECPKAFVSENIPCSYQNMSQLLHNYGFVVLVVGLVTLIFGGGLLQMVALPVISVGAFFFIMGLCVRAAGLS